MANKNEEKVSTEKNLHDLQNEFKNQQQKYANLDENYSILFIKNKINQISKNNIINISIF